MPGDSVRSGPTVVVVDYGMGNLHSVVQACRAVGLDAEIKAAPDELTRADALVLPGVGAMPDAMATLRQTGLAQAILEHVARGRPMLGICLGMQIMLGEGSEFGHHAGLGLLPGRVTRFPDRTSDGEALAVPHIGWNAVVPRRPWSETILASTAPGTRFYFVHSYVVEPDDANLVLAESRYGGHAFCAALRSDNIFGCQFHPERSGPAGLAVWQAFRELLTP